MLHIFPLKILSILRTHLIVLSLLEDNLYILKSTGWVINHMCKVPYNTWISVQFDNQEKVYVHQGPGIWESHLEFCLTQLLSQGQILS